MQLFGDAPASQVLRTRRTQGTIDELLECLNQRRFRKRDGNRASLFESIDRSALRPLPVQRYVMAEWKTVKANIDYHVEIDRHYYSVPYRLAGQQFEARSTAATVELFHDGKRIASHARSSAAYRHTTIHEHMPKSHQAHLEWTPSRLIRWGETVGSATAEVIRCMLAGKPHPEKGLSCLPRNPASGKSYSNERLEAASQRALQLQACSYSSLRSILKRSLDRQTSANHTRFGIQQARTAARKCARRRLLRSACDEQPEPT